MHILIYDSGKGGLSVFRFLENQLAGVGLQDKVKLSYFADEKNYPYGTKSDEELTKIIYSNLSQFSEQGVDVVGVACNTASGVIEKSNDLLRDAMNRVSTILEPTFSEITQLQPLQLYIIGSQYTIDHHVYGNKLGQDFPNMEIFERAEQDLINAIEHDQQNEILQGIHNVIQNVPNNWSLLLACTHFSLVKDLFETEIESQGKHIFLIDPAEELGKEILKKIMNL